MRTKGKISSWNDAKGYGFITPGSGGKRIFFHIKELSNSHRRPESGQSVTYTLSADKHGRPCAIHATLVGDHLQEGTRRKKGSLSIVAATLFIIIVAVSVLIDRIPPQILALYLIVSLLTIIIYAFDKSAARKGLWRTSESTLHLLSLAGGWPGALIAQQKFHHKSKKHSFRTVFWVTVLLNCGAFTWLFAPTGAAIVKSIMGRME